MSFEVVLSDLRSIFSEKELGSKKPRRLIEDDVQKWMKSTGMSEAALYSKIVLYLAHGFHASELTFEYCDAIMNDIFGLVVASHQQMAADVSEVYRAFDEGEYYHQDRPDADPVDAYTRPLVPDRSR